MFKEDRYALYSNATEYKAIVEALLEMGYEGKWFFGHRAEPKYDVGFILAGTDKKLKYGSQEYLEGKEVCNHEKLVVNFQTIATFKEREPEIIELYGKKYNADDVKRVLKRLNIVV